MSRMRFNLNSAVFRHAWLNLWDKHMTTGRINQISACRVTSVRFFQLAWQLAGPLTRTKLPNASIVADGCLQQTNFPSLALRLSWQGDNPVAGLLRSASHPHSVSVGLAFILARTNSIHMPRAGSTKQESTLREPARVKPDSYSTDYTSAERWEPTIRCWIAQLSVPCCSSRWTHDKLSSWNPQQGPGSDHGTDYSLLAVHSSLYSAADTSQASSSHLRMTGSALRPVVLFSRFACRRVVNPFKRARSCPVLIHIGVDVQVDKKKHRGWHRSKNFEKISPPR